MTGVDTMIEQWFEDDRVSQEKRKAGRHGKVSVREYLVASIACAINRIPASLDQIVHVINQHKSKKVRARFEPNDPIRLEQIRRARQITSKRIDDSSVQRLAAKINEAISPKIYPADRHYSHAELEEYDRQRSQWDRDMIPVRQKRMDDVTSAMLLPSWLLVPEEHRREWRGDVTSDATVVPIWGRGHKRCKCKKNGECGHWTSEAIDANAGWHAKQEDNRPYAERDGNDADTEYTHGYDYHYNLTTGPGVGTLFPAIILSGRVDRPAHAPGKNLADSLACIKLAGLPLGHVTTDLGYSQQSPESYAGLVKGMGYDLVMMYKGNQLGVQHTYKGCKLVEGTWYGPCLPQKLVDANSDYDNGKIDYQTWRTRIKAREAYALRPKSDTQNETSYVFRCPGHGDGATATCDYRKVTRNDAALVEAGRKTLAVVVNHPDKDLPSCSNKASISIPKSEGARWLQKLSYKSDKWIAVYGPERNQIEGKNGEAKNSLLGSLAQAGDRRHVGMGKQVIAILARTIATNVHSLLRFLKKADAPVSDPGFTPLSPFGHAWRRSDDKDHTPHRVTGRTVAEPINEPPPPPSIVPDIPEVA
ncbi:hypothetical protein [Demequina sp. NBRC 110055]|uniref:hypothetical protein n=1 Tax=Demequina sp. NBRC 110055 TaxID=1570344 RepID=UPI001184721C|nr:hypothetical protein [Demequina sp. NBRC 110055]